MPGIADHPAESDGKLPPGSTSPSLIDQIEQFAEAFIQEAAGSNSESIDSQKNIDTWAWAQQLSNLQASITQQNCLFSPIDQTLRPQRGAKTSTLPVLCRLLSSSRSYLSPHCAAATAEACGLQDLYQSCRASVIIRPVPECQLEDLRCLAKQRISNAWSIEAVKQGVAHAKSAQYQEARKCYDKAIQLDSENADAYVARGAASANERDFPAAAEDLRRALIIDPGSRNAAKYLEAVSARAIREGVLLGMDASAHGVQPILSAPPAPQTRTPGSPGLGSGHPMKPASPRCNQSVPIRQPQGGKRGRDSDSDDSSSDVSGDAGVVADGGHMKAALLAVLQARASSKKDSSKKDRSRKDRESRKTKTKHKKRSKDSHKAKGKRRRGTE